MQLEMTSTLLSNGKWRTKIKIGPTVTAISDASTLLESWKKALVDAAPLIDVLKQTDDIILDTIRSGR